MPDQAHTTQPQRNRGGPKSATGKQRSRANAIKHGLTSAQLLPEILQRDLIAEKYQLLEEEHRPATPTEAFFVREMARHDAALTRAEAMEEAILRRAAVAIDNTLLADDQGDELACEAQGNDWALAQAGTAHALEKISRYRTSHERAYAKSLAGLRKTQQRRGESRDATSSTAREFQSEAECETYLLERLSRGEVPCPRCGHRQGHWLGRRRKWQCQACRRQISLRQDTVMAKSPLRLQAWFSSIRLLIQDARASTAQLSAATGITRHATVRGMAEKIREALASPTSSQLLAGLNAVWKTPTH